MVSENITEESQVALAVFEAHCQQSPALGVNDFMLFIARKTF